jgi:hypothetical protein
MRAGFFPSRTLAFASLAFLLTSRAVPLTSRAIERLAQRVGRQFLFGQFALALQHQLERVQQVRLGLG